MKVIIVKKGVLGRRQSYEKVGCCKIVVCFMWQDYEVNKGWRVEEERLVRILDKGNRDKWKDMEVMLRNLVFI